MYLDEDAFLFLLFFDPRGWLGLILFILLAVLIGIGIYYSADKCEDKCDGLESRVLDNECYCVSEDGSLKQAP